MSIKSYTENGVTYFSVTVSSRSTKDRSIRVQKQRAGLTTLAAAKTVERDLKKETLHEVFKKEHADVCWGKLVGEWELALRDGDGLNKPVAESTSQDYLQALHTHTQAWWRRPATDITRADIREVYQNVALRGLSKSVADKLRSAINAMFAWAIETRRLKGISQSPAMGISTRLGREEEKRPEILTLSELRFLLISAKMASHPWYHVWALAALTGMRAGELCALRWEDVDLENGLVHVRRSANKRNDREGPTKGRYWRDVPISSELDSLLRELRALNPGPHVLPRIRELMKGEQARVLRAFCEAAGIPSIRFHTLRACFATQLLGAGVSVPRVMSICGWKALKTAQCYVRLSGIDVKGATEALKFLPPKEAGKVVNLFNRKDPG